MRSLEEPAADVGSASREQHPSSILYSILSGRQRGYPGGAVATCPCVRTRTVCLREPKVTCRLASGVMAKTFGFIQGSASFCGLPEAEQASLLRHCWAHLFVVGLAQEGVAVEVTDAPDSSLLRRILLAEEQEEEEERHRPTLAEVHRLRGVMKQLWRLELSPKEYAHLKAALLFNPGKKRPAKVPGSRLVPLKSLMSPLLQLLQV